MEPFKVDGLGDHRGALRAEINHIDLMLSRDDIAQCYVDEQITDSIVLDNEEMLLVVRAWLKKNPEMRNLL